MVKSISPATLISEPFAADSQAGDVSTFAHTLVVGNTDTFAPVSMRKACSVFAQRRVSVFRTAATEKSGVGSGAEVVGCQDDLAVGLSLGLGFGLKTHGGLQF